MLASSIYPLAINAQNIGQTSQPLIVKKSTIWQEKNISVCWENAGNNNTERNWVRDAIARTWEKESTIRFVNWGNCQADTKGIRILIDDVRPHTKGLGNNLDGKKNGMVLNFTFANWTGAVNGKELCQNGGRSPSGFNSPNRIASTTEQEFCVKVIAAHDGLLLDDNN